jgi:hypothetical protein
VGKSKSDPRRRRQLSAIFLSIQRRKGTAAAKAEYRKQQREGYAPVARDDQRKRRHRKRALHRASQGKS